MACEREDLWFIPVAAVALALVPCTQIEYVSAPLRVADFQHRTVQDDSLAPISGGHGTCIVCCLMLLMLSAELHVVTGRHLVQECGHLVLGPHFLLMGACQAHPSAIDLPDVHPRRGGQIWRKQVPDILLQACNFHHASMNDMTDVLHKVRLLCQRHIALQLHGGLYLSCRCEEVRDMLI